MKNSIKIGFLLIVIMCVSVNLLSAEDINFKANNQPQLTFKKITFTVSDSWFSRDKAHHFLTSAFLTTAGYYYCRNEQGLPNNRSQQGAVSFSLSLGLIKEIRDGMQKKNSFSWKDLTADILGTALGVILVAD